MSLLMDALKRAERARRAEVERAKVEGRAPQAPELALDPMEEAAPTVLSRAAEPSRAAGVGTDDSLELTPPEVRREIESLEDSVLDDATERWNESEDDEAPRAGAPRGDDSLSLSMGYSDIPLDETGATLPSMRAAQRSVQDYFDGTHSMSLSMEDVQGAIEAERGAGDDPVREPGHDTERGGTTARRRAQSVLDARAIAPSNTGRNIALVLVLVLLVAGLGGAGVMYKDRILAMLDGRSSVVVRKAPPPAAPATQVASAGASAQPPAEVVAAERDALLRAAESARAEERALAEAAASARAAMQAQAEKAAPAAPAPVEATAAATPPAPTPEVPPDAAVAAPARAAAAPPLATVPLAEVLKDAQVRPGLMAPAPGLKITRRRAPGRTHGELMQAFDAFQQGDDGQAMSLYQKILTREPRNRDAMLGAAAIYMRARAYEQAAGYYVEVLRRTPGDPVAQAALISLQNDLDPVSGESRLKTLLRASPDDANLHFSLGNLYAEQGRWPEAQQAYFDACRLDGENPDHAFNLAVSLDRLAQHRAAAQYYDRALTLAAARPPAFQPEQARARIAALAAN